MTAFAELGVMPEIVQAIEDIDWLLPTDIQAEAMPLILGGGDVLMAAETGSGKTGAFCLPIIQIVHETLRDRQEGRTPRALTTAAGSKKCTLSAFDRGENFAISPDGLLCQCREQRAWEGCRSSHGVGAGKVYYEATVTDEGLCRIGWSTRKATHELGKDEHGFGYGGTGKKSSSSQFDDYGESFGKADTIGCFLDLEVFTISFSKNGADLGEAFNIPKRLQGSTFFAAVTLKNAEIQFNFGDSPFKYPPKGGFVGLAKAQDLVAAGASQIKTGHVNLKAPFALIIEPSRELAQQTHDQITLFKKYLKSPSVRELLVIGGDSAKDQIRALSNGVDIVCGTPGRLDDMISTGKLDLSNIQFFVLDEADGLLSQGYGSLVDKIYQQIPKVSPIGRRLQMIVCSATLHSFEVKKLADKLMHFPTWVDLKGQDSVPDTVHHVVCYVDPVGDTSWHKLPKRIKTDSIHYHDDTKPGRRSAETLSEAVKLLKAEYLLRAIDEHEMDQAILFCRTKLDCDNMEQYLMSHGGHSSMVNKYSCVCLHGDRRPQERKANLQAFKDGEVRFLICTDVAARGIDVHGIPYVVNVTMPDDKQNYIHRIGRVGRADRMGLAISLVSTVKEKVWYHSCPSRGKSCNNTNLKERGGCAIWYDEKQYLAEIEEHLGVSIPETDRSLKVETDDFDGKVVYGQKRSNKGAAYMDHVEQLAPSVKKLAELERQVQTNFLCNQHLIA
ncbi:ATP-dependent RNA helicase DDX1-like [Dysidea avara]|uniref:ATP-dependent RNA helicase DDX1-like n=1 Tax=Dysidea avara TaxID=196820 RepID=UPI0033293D79